MTRVDITRGQRVTWAVDAAGRLAHNGAQSLVRAQRSETSMWQVVLAPVTIAGKGTFDTGMPGYEGVEALDGKISMTIRIGAGGVSFNLSMPYPICGSSFAVCGDSVTIDVEPTDTQTGYTDANKPVVVGWIAATAAPQTTTPLVQWLASEVGANAGVVRPWSRYLWVSQTDETATAVVEFTGSTIGAAGVDVALPAGFGVVRIPIPLGATRYEVTPSAGSTCVGLEYAFT